MEKAHASPRQTPQRNKDPHTLGCLWVREIARGGTWGEGKGETAGGWVPRKLISEAKGHILS